MVEFIRAGGLPVQLVVLTVAVIAIVVQAARAFRWFFLKDHSKESFLCHATLPLYLAGVTFLLGVLGTVLGYYTVFTKWAAGSISEMQLRVGLYEPLTCAITATAFAATIVICQILIQSRLHTLRIPQRLATGD